MSADTFHQRVPHWTYQFSNPVKDEINLILSNSVVPAGIVVSGIFFAWDQLVWVKKATVCTGANFIYKEKSKDYERYLTPSNLANKNAVLKLA